MQCKIICRRFGAGEWIVVGVNCDMVCQFKRLPCRRCGATIVPSTRPTLAMRWSPAHEKNRVLHDDVFLRIHVACPALILHSSSILYRSIVCREQWIHWMGSNDMNRFDFDLWNKWTYDWSQWAFMLTADDSHSWHLYISIRDLS